MSVNIKMASINKRTMEIPPVHLTSYLNRSFQTSKECDILKFRKKWINTTKSFYYKDLLAHYSCVNALEFSDDGSLLFSGGDDRRVLMWNVDDALFKICVPKILRGEHVSNIFCLAVDSFNKRVLSGSNDCQVLAHDYVNGRTVDVFDDSSPIFCISLQCDNPRVIVTAAEDGRILLYDTRSSEPEPTVIAKFKDPFHGVMFHPTEGSLLATANSEKGVDIWDIRTPRKRLIHCCDGHGMAVRWNDSGTHLLCIRNRETAVLINPKSSKCLQFDSPTYYNACTMKSCCFGGENDEYIMSGSDDFNIHMWKIPNPWPDSGCVNKADITLRGHRSIVNQVRYSQQRQLIATSGVEKTIKLWSPFSLPNGMGERGAEESPQGRYMCSAALCKLNKGLINFGQNDDINEDRAMLHFFDYLLREELSEDSRPRNSRGDVGKRKKMNLNHFLTESKKSVCTLRTSLSSLEESQNAMNRPVRFSNAISTLLSSDDSSSDSLITSSSSEASNFPSREGIYSRIERDGVCSENCTCDICDPPANSSSCSDDSFH